MIHSGFVKKMVLQAEPTVAYQLSLNDVLVPLNPLLGKKVTLEFNGKIHCIYCDRAIKKTYQQGYCFPCSQKLARCDFCILKPSTCHYHLGSCREPEWGVQNCMIPHYVYLSVTSGLKVGITRHTQIPTRWLDQGATQAIQLYEVQTRRQSGMIEQAFATRIKDRTDWRAMLKGDHIPVDLTHNALELCEQSQDDLKTALSLFDSADIKRIEQAPEHHFKYPVLEYPKKVTALNLEKTPLIEGTLIGMKGQYLILDTGVLNIRKYTGYELSFSS